VVDSKVSEAPILKDAEEVEKPPVAAAAEDEV
jgi:hypothetical protein